MRSVPVATDRRSRFGRRLWIFWALVLVCLLLLALAGAWHLKMRETIMSQALQTFGWEALTIDPVVPLWLGAWIGADRYPNGFAKVVGVSLDNPTLSDDDLREVVAELVHL